MNAHTSGPRDPAQAHISCEQHPVTDVPSSDETETVVRREPAILLCKTHDLRNEFARKIESLKAGVLKLLPILFREIQHLGVSDGQRDDEAVWQRQHRGQQTNLVQVNQTTRIVDDYTNHAACGPRISCSISRSGRLSSWAARTGANSCSPSPRQTKDSKRCGFSKAAQP